VNVTGESKNHLLIGPYFRPTKQPVLPSWCDYHSFSISKKIICIGVIRALLTLGVFIFCTVILAVVDGIPLGNTT
jgi:hypothetical protein